MTIQLIHADFASALSDVRRIADDLQQHRRRVERSVDVLLDGGWSGGAATAYADGWATWREGCAAVLDGLEVLAELLELARADLVLQDDAVAALFGGAA